MMNRWRKEPGPRLEGSSPLDSGKVQAPCIVNAPGGGFRLFYTAIGPAKPYPACQGYILSAFSRDGLNFETEPGIRLAPDPSQPSMSRRVLAPSIVRCRGDCWRMYFESRGPADRPTTIRSAISYDMLHWELEDGIRLQTHGGVGAPRFLPLPSGGGRLYCFNKEYGEPGLAGGAILSQNVISAATSDGLRFDIDSGCRVRDRQTVEDSAGITAAEVIAPESDDGDWAMVYSAWQDVPPGTVLPTHPSNDAKIADVKGIDFAKTSIAADMAGYRSRIFLAKSKDGLLWEPGTCVIEGGGYHAEGIDAVHAEDMSVVRLADGRYRMYYAACDRHSAWHIASAITKTGSETTG